MDVVLIAGLWLPATIWHGVAEELVRSGHRAMPVPLPGVDDGATATLDDQIAAVLAVVERAERPLLVGHSAAATLAWIVADRRPDVVAGTALVGGFPAANGSGYAALFDIVDGAMPFPGWEPFDGVDSADLDNDARAYIEAMAVPVPEGVAAAPVVLSDDRRFGLPTVLVCPEYSPEQAAAWLAAGDIPELERAERLSYVDIASGHWPMITQPAALAAILADIASTM